MRKIGLPKIGEIVVCQITKINPNSAFARMIEYDKIGMIHVSEVASGWVRDIREFLKENQYVVCLVKDIENEMISLSIKRVKKEDANRKLNEFKREKRAEKLLEMAGKLLKKNIDQMYKEVGYKLYEEFGSLYKALEIALKNEELFRSKGLPEKWTNAIIEIAKKSFVEKTYEIKGELTLISYKPDGIEVIKKILKKAEDLGFEVKYISAPRYMLICKGKNYKDLETKLKTEGENLVKEIKRSGGEGSFKIIQG
jgi:translation initiation factor 2 subunit 1